MTGRRETSQCDCKQNPYQFWPSLLITAPLLLLLLAHNCNKSPAQRVNRGQRGKKCAEKLPNTACFCCLAFFNSSPVCVCRGSALVAFHVSVRQYMRGIVEKTYQNFSKSCNTIQTYIVHEYNINYTTSVHVCDDVVPSIHRFNSSPLTMHTLAVK